MKYLVVIEILTLAFLILAAAKEHVEVGGTARWQVLHGFYDLVLNDVTIRNHTITAFAATSEPRSEFSLFNLICRRCGA